MLAESYRLHLHTEFSRAVRRGRRVGRTDLVIHILLVDDEFEPTRIGGPHIGLIVSKAVGNAVVRHRVSRRLRHVCATLVSDGSLPTEADIVIRALPSAATASSAELAGQVRGGLGKAMRTRP